MPKKVFFSSFYNLHRERDILPRLLFGKKIPLYSYNIRILYPMKNFTFILKSMHFHIQEANISCLPKFRTYCPITNVELQKKTYCVNNQSLINMPLFCFSFCFPPCPDSCLMPVKSIICSKLVSRASKSIHPSAFV